MKTREHLGPIWHCSLTVSWKILKCFFSFNFFFFGVFEFFWCDNVKNSFFLFKKNIILIHFQAKNTLKNNLYYISKQTLKGKKHYLAMNSDWNDLWVTRKIMSEVISRWKNPKENTFGAELKQDCKQQQNPGKWINTYSFRRIISWCIPSSKINNRNFLATSAI